MRYILLSSILFNVYFQQISRVAINMMVYQLLGKEKVVMKSQYREIAWSQ